MKENLNNKPKDVLIKYISHGNIIQASSAICEIVRRKDSSPDVVETLKASKEDTKVFWNNYLISDFAIAALDILGIEKYEGDRDEIKGLIKERLNFE